MAVDRVEKRLKLVTATLDAAQIPYAVIGGNAVAAWVAQADPSATRSTRDVDLLVDQADVPQITAALKNVGFERHDLRSMVLFTDPAEPSKRAGVHLVWAGRKVRPSYVCEAPVLSEIVRDPQGFWVLDLPALLRMKLTSHRDIDRVHVADLISVGLIDDKMRADLTTELLARLADIERTLADES